MANGENGSRPRVQPGETLRRLRVRLGLSTRQVAALSCAVARNQGSDEFSISHARLVQVENEGSIPSIQKLFTLSSVYGVSVQELFAAYVNLEAASGLHASMSIPRTHLASIDRPGARKTIPFPAHLSSTGRIAETDVLSHIVQAWGEVPVSLLEYLRLPDARYGFIGLADYTMYPLIRPGSVVQIEDCRKVAAPAPYRTEFDRPIYFLESRSGYLCSWCEVNSGRLCSIPHTLSPCRQQVFAYPADVEVVGRVTGVALRLIRADQGVRERATAG